MKLRAIHYILRAIPYGINITLESVRQKIDTLTTKAACKWWGVKLGKAVTFRGRPIFRQHPTANISIGTGCKFNSAQWSNSIGLNRRCMITATRDAIISIGEHSGFSATIIAASKSITIGNRVLFGGNCTIVDTDRHPIHHKARAEGEQAPTKPIHIGNDVFVGMNCFILKGSYIGDGSVIAANSVVTGYIPSQVIAGGSPAKVIKKIRGCPR